MDDEQILNIVRQLRDIGNAILYTTHYMAEAEGLCDRLGIMNQGKLVAMGTLDALLANLECRETIELRGLPLLQGARVVPRSHHLQG